MKVGFQIFGDSYERFFEQVHSILPRVYEWVAFEHRNYPGFTNNDFTPLVMAKVTQVRLAQQITKANQVDLIFQIDMRMELTFHVLDNKGKEEWRMVITIERLEPTE